MPIRRFTSRECVWVSSDRFEGQEKGQHYMMYLISAVFENAQKFFLFFFIFFKFMSHQTAVPFRRTFQVPFDLKHKVNYYN